MSFKMHFVNLNLIGVAGECDRRTDRQTEWPLSLTLWDARWNLYCCLLAGISVDYSTDGQQQQQLYRRSTTTVAPVIQERMCYSSRSILFALGISTCLFPCNSSPFRFVRYAYVLCSPLIIRSLLPVCIACRLCLHERYRSMHIHECEWIWIMHAPIGDADN